MSRAKNWRDVKSDKKITLTFDKHIIDKVVENCATLGGHRSNKMTPAQINIAVSSVIKAGVNPDGSKGSIQNVALSDVSTRRRGNKLMKETVEKHWLSYQAPQNIVLHSDGKKMENISDVKGKTERLPLGITGFKVSTSRKIYISLYFCILLSLSLKRMLRNPSGIHTQSKIFSRPDYMY